MNPNLEMTFWTGGVFAATTMIALIVMQAIGFWWNGRTAQKDIATISNAPQRDCATHTIPRANEGTNRWAIYSFLAISGMAFVFLIVKDTGHVLLSVLGILAVAPYVYLEKKHAERTTWLTRSSVARGLDEMQALATSQNAAEILDAQPWLERNLKRSTFFQQFDARLTQWIGQGLAQRGSKTDLENLARQMQSEDLFQFVRRAYAGGKDGDARRVFLDAANAVGERIYLDAESVALRMLSQNSWLWFALIAVLLAAVLLALGWNK